MNAIPAKLTTLQKRGGAMKLVNLTPKAERALRLTHLTTLFEIFTSEAEALQTFGPRKPGA